MAAFMNHSTQPDGTSIAASTISSTGQAPLPGPVDVLNACLTIDTRYFGVSYALKYRRASLSTNPS